MNAGDFLSSIVKSAGVPEDNEHFVAIMANKELATADFPDELASKIHSKLLTVDAAKNNSDINQHFYDKHKAENFNAVDGRLEELASKYEFGEDKIKALKETEGTFNRIDFFGENLVSLYKAQLEEAKNKTDDPKAKERLEELQTKVNTLNAEMSTFKESHMPTKEFEDLQDGYESRIKDMGIKSKLSGYTYANGDVDSTVNITMAHTLLENELTQKGLKITDKDGILTLEKTDGTEYFIDNAKVDLKGFMDTTLAHYKLLKTTETTPSPGAPPLVTPPVSEIKIAENAPKGLEAGLALMKESNDAAILELIK